jgi:hypothetical protein
MGGGSGRTLSCNMVAGDRWARASSGLGRGTGSWHDCTAIEPSPNGHDAHHKKCDAQHPCGDHNDEGHLPVSTAHPHNVQPSRAVVTPRTGMALGCDVGLGLQAHRVTFAAQARLSPIRAKNSLNAASGRGSCSDMIPRSPHQPPVRCALHHCRRLQGPQVRRHTGYRGR